MAEQLVTLVNPNKIHPGVAPYALDILTTVLEQAGFEVEVVDLTFERHRWAEVLAEYFASRSPLLVGVSVRNTDTNSSIDQMVFLPEHKEIIDEVKRLTDAPVITGGAAFGTMPFGLVEYFGVPYAVSGPGDTVIVELAQCLAENRDPSGIEGLILRDGDTIRQVPQATPYERVITLRGKPLFNQTGPLEAQLPYRRRSETAFRVDNTEYYAKGGLGSILAKNGCSFYCAHCCEFVTKGRRMSTRGIASTVSELEALCAQGIHDIHTVDSEFNFKFDNAKALLREIVERKAADPSSALHELKLWVYAQPTPFDEEFADLLMSAGLGGINFGTDHADDEMLKAWKVAAPDSPTYYGWADAKRANDWIMERGGFTCHEFLLGMPGENEQTLRTCVERALSLGSRSFGLTLGIRVFPYQPLGMQLAEECDGVRTLPGLQSNTAKKPIVLRPLDKCESRAAYELQFIFDEEMNVRPVFYFSPGLPEPAEVVNDPAGKRHRSLQFLHDIIPEEEIGRIMIQPVPGAEHRGNTQVDSALLLALFKLGYRGSAWGWWPELDRIAAEAREKGLLDD